METGKSDESANVKHMPTFAFTTRPPPMWIGKGQAGHAFCRFCPHQQQTMLSSDPTNNCSHSKTRRARRALAHSSIALLSASPGR